MRANVSLPVLSLVCVGCWTAAVPARAQEAPSLRYAPRIGDRVHTIFRKSLTLTIQDFEGTGDDVTVLDSLTLEATALESRTERVMAGDGDSLTIQRTLDSVRARSRTPGGPWEDSRPDPLVGATVRLVVNARLQVASFEVIGDDPPDASAQPDRLRGAAAGFEFSFPVRPVAVGESWATDVVFPFRSIVDLEQLAGGVPRAQDLLGRGGFTLDSLVERRTDTLAYLSVEGSFIPATVSDTLPDVRAPTALAGAFAGRLVWSTGWNAFVSGSVRTVITMRSRFPEEDGGGGTMLRYNVSNVFSVRP